MSKKQLLLACLLFVGLIGQAQVDGPQSIFYYQEGEQLLLEGKVKKAKKSFERAVDANKNFAAAYRGLALCYEDELAYEKAIDAYEKVVSLDSLFARNVYYHLGLLYYKKGENKAALKCFETFDMMLEVPKEEEPARWALEWQEDYKMKIDNHIKACEIALDSTAFVNVTEVYNLDDVINTAANEYFPYLANDQRLLFFSRRADDKDDEDLYYSYYRDEDWVLPGKVKKINTNKNEGMSTFVRDGRTMFFTVCGRKEVIGGCDIWQADVRGSEVLDVEPIVGFPNSEKWESEANVNCDGTLLIFASNRPGGVGGTDLWMSRKIPGTDRWDEPRNLGIKINTPFNEEAPFITNDGKTLYFSSTGHLGLGEQDIFVSWWDEKTDSWNTPINLGPPVNSPHRELGFFLSADGMTGYFASDRPEGYGGMDIYKFKLNDKLHADPITYVEGYVRDMRTDLGVETVVKINGRPDLKTDEYGRFFMCVGADEVLDMRVDEENYWPYHNNFVIPKWDNKQFYAIELLLMSDDELTAKSVVVEEKEPNEAEVSMVVREYSHLVYFEFDKDQIVDEELNKLGDFVEAMKAKDIQSIEIIGFSDDIGTVDYNFQLSESRAKNIGLFLINNELSVGKIYMEGKGELENELPKAQNRRVEVKVKVLEEE